MKRKYLLLISCLYGSICFGQSTNNFPPAGDATLGWNNRLMVGTGTLGHPSVEANNYTRLVLSHNMYWDNFNSRWVVQGGGSSDFSFMRFENGGHISFFARTHYGDGYILTNAELESFRLLTIGSNGNVGTGTAAPSDKLSVNGNIRAKEIKVETANWPDYVFADDYKLPGLKETASYITTNKHLPGMPSATEVTVEGVSLGEMNRNLLEKVEELTLLLIAEQKARARLEVKVSELGNAVKINYKYE